jgi:hypothetical protein
MERRSRHERSNTLATIIEDPFATALVVLVVFAILIIGLAMHFSIYNEGDFFKKYHG